MGRGRRSTADIKDPGEKMRTVVMGSGSHFYCPMGRLATAIREALDPARAPGKCRTLVDMSSAERDAISRRCGAPLR